MQRKVKEVLESCLITHVGRNNKGSVHCLCDVSIQSQNATALLQRENHDSRSHLVAG
jgi:hypothetical protein